MDKTYVRSPSSNDVERQIEAVRLRAEIEILQLETQLMIQDLSSNIPTKRSSTPKHNRQPKPQDTLHCFSPIVKVEPERRQKNEDPTVEAFTSMAAAVRETVSLPKPEILEFNGDPKNYIKFMKCFEANIERRVEDYGLKLNYLIQHCCDSVKEDISDCVVLDDEEGYFKAKDILARRYGRPHIIARSYIQELLSGPSIAQNDGNMLQKLASKMQVCEMTLSKMGYLADLNNSENLIKISRKLPPNLRSKWAVKADTIIEEGREPSFKDLSIFVERNSRVFLTMYGQDLQEDSRAPKGQRKGGNVFATETVDDSERNSHPVCVLCEGSHDVINCYQFKAMPYESRKAMSRQMGLCDNCLHRGHRSRACGMKRQCDIQGCNVFYKHCSFLHPPAPVYAQAPASAIPHAPVLTPAPSMSLPATPNESARHHATSYSTIAGKRVFLRVVPVKVTAGRFTKNTFAMLDDCSDVSLCTAKLAKDLGAELKKRQFTLSSVGAESRSFDESEVHLRVTAIDDSDSVELDKVWTVQKIPVSARCIPKQADVKRWPHLRDLVLPEIQMSDIELLIGSDTPEVFWQLEERRGRRREPVGIRSILGWSVIGPSHSDDSAMNSGNVNFIQTSDDLLHEQVERFWKSDFDDHPSVKAAFSVEDKRALKKMEETTSLQNGHYEIGLPWRDEEPKLPNNRMSAEIRMKSLKKKFQKDSSLKESYSKTINDYVAKGYARKVVANSVNTPTTWYLPHHPVFHPKKPGKIRVVFDCRAKFRGTSLNEKLLQGPDFLNSLLGVLMRFREGPVAIKGDIEAMFHQVRVRECDRPSLRFLWWDGDENEEPVDYEMMVHVFGATSSPSCCCYALKRTAEDNKTKFDEATIDAVRNNFYMDDCLKSTQTEDEAIKIVTELCELLKSGGFRITKWVSNSDRVLKHIPESERAETVVNLDFNEFPVERSLGVMWNVKMDHFCFSSVLKENAITRRGILSTVSSLFDPFGFVAPIALTPKKLLQETWRQKHGWDSPLEDSIAREWQKWLTELPQLSSVKITRCYIPKDFGSVVTTQLHCFSDASEDGYGAAVYLVLTNAEGKKHCVFVVGKSRTAPLKHVTIPRLELTAAVVAIRLYNMVQEELKFSCDRVVFWTDSTSVLMYVKNETRRFKTFVANRLATIQESSDPQQWRWVNTGLNPADIASRGLSPSDAEGLERWLLGPGFLLKNEDLWPSQPKCAKISEDDPEVKEERYVNATTEETHVLITFSERYSSFYKLIKAVAWLIRFKKFCISRYLKKESRIPSGELTVAELDESRDELLRQLQKNSFPEEISKTCKISKSSSIRRLAPTISNGLLCVGGRLERATLDYETQHPIILPSHSHITDIIVQDHHARVGHAGCDFVLASVRKKYWIVKGKATVRRVIGKCFECRRRNARRGEQLMAPLPAARVTAEKPPFTFVGVDYFGPILVKQARSHVKRYGCLFTCLTSRAVHIEIAHSLDTDSFLSALFRFICRRGCPEEIYSDNGSNFKSGERELREMLQKMEQAKIHDRLRRQEIQWFFNPPGASHMGGVWERMIRSTKDILKVLLKEQTVNDETLLTLMAEVEKILNDRPLTPPGSDATDLEPLTPSRLLLLRPNTSVPCGVFENHDSVYARRWFRQAQYLASVFWKRWIAEYLPTLQARQKWNDSARNFEINDIVLVVDERLPRGQWPIARVTKVYPDCHGKVRSVEVFAGGSVKDRPIAKLCLLEAAAEYTSNPRTNTLERENDGKEKDRDNLVNRPKRTLRTPKRYKDYVRN